MPKEGAFHHLIIVSYRRQAKKSKGNGYAIQYDFMLLTVRFVGFSLIEQICILKKPGVKDINLEKCRGQGYDEEANLRGAHGGLEKLIKDKQPRANYVHCSTRNRNLVLNDACNNVPHVSWDLPQTRKHGKGSMGQKGLGTSAVDHSFRIIPEQYFSGVENIDNYLENIDHNLAYYEIPAQLTCAYLKGHLKGRALDWFEVLGYRVIEDKTTDYAHLKQALSEQFPVVRNRSELETQFYSSSQRRDQQPSDFIYELLKIHKVLKLEMSEEKLIDHVVSRLEPQILDYVEVRHPRNTANLLQIVDKYEERFMRRQIRGSSEGFRSSGPNKGNRFNTRHRQENWRENGNIARYANNSRPQGEFNRFENQGFANNRRFEGRRQGGQSDQRFHNQGGRQSGSRNSSFRGQNERSTTGSSKALLIINHIDKMLRDGTIRPINSPYASPVVLTRKKNDLPPDSPEAYRFAIDYRKLNGITKYPRYPLPW
ncbi:uncharacterized protein TNCV_696831 [Trichonephila clavipes]|nr:uncharacterized protein TNCV_696831 [Trichonephila clavipes]